MNKPHQSDRSRTNVCTLHELKKYSVCLWSTTLCRTMIVILTERRINPIRLQSEGTERNGPLHKDRDSFTDLETLFFFIQWNQFNPSSSSINQILTFYKKNAERYTPGMCETYSDTPLTWLLLNSDRQEIKHIKYRIECIKHSFIMSSG